MRLLRVLMVGLVICAHPADAAAQFRTEPFTTSNGLPQNTVAALALDVQPHFYETQWFGALCAAAALALGSAAYALRVRQLKRNERRLTKLVAIRTAELQERTAQLEVANQALGELAALDALTGLANRRRFDVFVQQEWVRARRTRAPLSLLLVDTDFFKKYNDTYGHQAGDECLKAVASVLRAAASRVSDLAARYGGEEFAVVLAGTGGEGALLVAETIRANVEALGIPHVHGPAGVVTVSIGVSSTVPDLDASLSTLIALCDKALYEAKGSGRNTVRAQAADPRAGADQRTSIA